MSEGAVRTVPGEGVRMSEAEQEVALAETRAVLDAAVGAWTAARYSAGKAQAVPAGHADRLGAIWR